MRLASSESAQRVSAGVESGGVGNVNRVSTGERPTAVAFVPGSVLGRAIG